ncbi:HAD family hydrolase [Marinimicrobium sp. ABcell2]|uniref:HAD family hydrolase n=1 Tax=Marinimicrobium sp. ABcell2 TaxID=3069751 RepID=UPI0027AE4787|nr:HAD-IA family hydrolase [Marinimicrobium sp. ABcell2]MDQ2078065.1 HAD-IA family hydrolase [Marinimicrobium sp. ABcell2]
MLNNLAQESPRVPDQKIRAVIFDLDGTLLDTAPDFVVVVNQLLTERDQPTLAPETIRTTVSNGARGLISLAFGIDEKHSDFPELRQRLLDIYSNHLAVYTQPFPGMMELLHDLDQRGIYWGLATNKPFAYTEPLMAALNLQPEPVTVICPDHVEQRKPHPESLLLAAKHVGCLPEEIIYVGDHKRDIDCGRQAGSITIAAGYGYIEPEDDINTWEADYRADSVAELRSIIEQLLINQ